MTKLEFLDSLRKGLAGMPLEDIEKFVEYYKESIEDRMEDGLSEEDAVSAMGTVEEVIASIPVENPAPAPKTEEKKAKKKWGALEIVLLILGFPLWFPLIVTVFSVVLTVYIVLWTAVISLYALPVSLGVSALGMAVACGICAVTGQIAFALLALGACLALVGLTIFSFLLCNLCVKAVAWCTKTLWKVIKGIFV
ncbi:MAG: DUF1700 domain-containing protein [Oscillospiraceae bacterium]|nr:DUF1700 domain-containing protein [Oscillospiraceae bacterium]